MAESGAEVLVVPNGSPFRRGKFDVRMHHMVARVVETGLPLVYVNMVGGQDDQVFDGGSFVLNPGGKLAVQLPVFDEVMEHVDFEETAQGWRAAAGPLEVHPGPIEQAYRAMCVGLGDYLRKTGFGGALLGLSGGVDSALVAAIAVDALGAENVRCVMLPSEFTSAPSLEDAAAVAGAARVPAGRALDRAGAGGGDGDAGAALRGARGRRDRGEPAVAAAGGDADGDVEQVRRDAADDGEQVGDRGGVCDDLRGHGGRVQSDQGRLQDARCSRSAAGGTRTTGGG